MLTQNMSALQSLTSIITDNVKVVEDAYTSNNLPVPSLNELFKPSALEGDPKVLEAKQLIVASAAQLIATVRSPAETVMNYAGDMFTTATLGFAVEVNIADILKAYGDEKGLHVSQISSYNGVDASYLSRVLRYLATRHVFKEVTPDVFANNKISSLLLKAKTLEEVTSDPMGKFDGAPLAAFVSSSADDMLKSCTFLSTFLQSPGTGSAPFNMALATNKKMWDWYQEDGNESKSRRFTAAMKGGAEARFPPQLFTAAFSELRFKTNDVVVDVGGSIGSLVLILKKEYPDLLFVVQDLQRQIIDAKHFWDTNDPEAIVSGKVKLQVHDFFTPQPIHDAAVYVLRVVIHDWPDAEAIKILSLLRSAASNRSKLVIFDNIARHTCDDPETKTISSNKIPKPLLSNLGVGGSGFETSLDMQMLTLFNGKERTGREFKDLGEKTGWRLESVKPGALGTFIFSAA
ncbi:S-adenosyl-L-methionine-dependent methyltransferase [Cyathus striatus]|nr:S-adenosyl-L-methionine-dependent methyltransferase [Cyathus striatus]